MEIIVPQPYQGPVDEESASEDDEEHDDDEEANAVIEIEMAGADEEEWEDMSSEQEDEMEGDPDHPYIEEEQLNPFLDDIENPSDEEESEEGSEISENYGHDIRSFFGGNGPRVERTRVSNLPGHPLDRGGTNWSVDSRMINAGNTMAELNVLAPRTRSGLEETTHPLLVESSEPRQFDYTFFRNSISGVDNRDAYEVYREIFGNGLDHPLEISLMLSSQGAPLDGGVSSLQSQKPELTTEEKQLIVVHGHRIMQTVDRWHQEAKIIHGQKMNEVASTICNGILNGLVPLALEANRKADEARKLELERLERDRLEKEEEERSKAQKEVDSHPNAEMSVDPIVSTSMESDEPERQVIMIDGVPVDITGSGIDITFLEALPDDLRQEVIHEHMRERTIARQEVVTGSMNLSTDFLNALPPDMRQEVIEQERLEAENRRLAEERAANRGSNAVAESNVKPKAPSSKESAHLLDLSGIASLIRLIFLPEAREKESLEKLLSNLCENSKSRTDILGLLLAVLVHEPSSLVGVERLFAQILGKQHFGSSAADVTTANQMPYLVSQRCLQVLSFLSSHVSSIGKYFLTETDLSLFPKTPKNVKKGKGKDRPGPHSSYPIVLLLNLLERPLYLSNHPVLEELILLLATLLRPLAHVAKKKFLPDTSNPNEKTPLKDRPEFKLPIIPISSVQAVVSVLKDSVCTAKTFQSTLSVLQHLCSYPENFRVIVQELLSSSVELSQLISKDVYTLLGMLKSLDEKETPGTDLLTPFTSPAAPQAKFLRILKSIDYLFSKHHSICELM
jgi:E3 ubiquitin-protein ligase HUWE1